MSWICTAGIVLLPALYFLLPTKVQLRIDAFFDRVAQTLNPKLIIERRNSIRRQASRTGSDGTGSSDSPRALGVPKVITA